MPSKPIVREIRSTDIPQTAALMEKMWRGHGQEAYLIDPAKIMIPVAGYIEELTANDKTSVLVATVEERVVGVMTYGVRLLPSFYRDNEEFYLDDLCVAPDMRGQGIAGQLIEAAEKLVAKRDIHVLTGKIWSFNTASQSVFRKQHFTNDYSYWHKQV